MAVCWGQKGQTCEAVLVQGVKQVILWQGRMQLYLTG